MGALKEKSYCPISFVHEAHPVFVIASFFPHISFMSGIHSIASIHKKILFCQIYTNSFLGYKAVLDSTFVILN